MVSEKMRSEDQSRVGVAKILKPTEVSCVPLSLNNQKPHWNWEVSLRGLQRDSMEFF